MHIVHTSDIPQQKITSLRRFCIQKHYRIATFQSAPTLLKDHADQLTEAGFFYTFKDNIIQCYNCNLAINDWTPKYQPHMIHILWSPHCTINITPQQHDITSMQQLLSNKNNEIYPIHYFIAISRLRHYIMFPKLIIQDSEIDENSLNVWTSTLHKDIKISYNYTRDALYKRHSSLTMKKPYQNNLPKPETPQQWFRKTLMIKDYELTKQHRNKRDYRNIHKNFRHLNTNMKNKYYNLAIMDTKKYKASQIENHFSAQGLTIGYESPLTYNVTVQITQPIVTHALVSNLLTHKIYKLLSTN